LYGQKLDEKLKVTFISPIVDAKLHTFEVKCVADSIAAKLKPGQSVQLRFTFNERLALAAPSDALVKDGEGWAVFAPQGSSAHKIPVEKGEEKNGWTEILSSEVEKGMAVISEGQAFLRDRDRIRIIE
jgi:multidrug efflux pump subunit AcrA (membrane-fusion protein)